MKRAIAILLIVLSFSIALSASAADIISLQFSYPPIDSLMATTKQSTIHRTLQIIGLIKGVTMCPTVLLRFLMRQVKAGGAFLCFVLIFFRMTPMRSFIKM